MKTPHFCLLMAITISCFVLAENSEGITASIYYSTAIIISCMGIAIIGRD